ncbi:hypothetical protein AKJ09_02548 [Labilithrix luteola]|uniref:Lipoprotein n=1 Tax=Labilithrix luteola TaxID=1391654 RepID=A0A0K1PRY3_9BACT|nr:hypothetical protein [Labilithrix luteola]AKU95884.1 hypothetical protein AKJ09_02548 [Labilithrix luteola]
MTRFALRSAVLVVAFGSFTLAACDLIKKGGADASADTVAAVVDAAPVVTPAATVTAAAPAETAAPLAVAPAVTTAAPGATHTAAPVVVADAGKAADAAAPADAGNAAPVPTPTLQIPTSIPGFDAGAFKPPAGFPTTLPTWPPPQPTTPKK